MNITVSIISQYYKSEINEEINKKKIDKYKNNPTKLIGILANDDPASRQYAEWTKKACNKDNIIYELYVSFKY